MGDKKGGEGRTEGPTSVQLVRQLVDQYSDQEREVLRIQVEFVSPGIYAVTVHERGDAEPERFFALPSDHPYDKRPPVAR